MQIHFEQLLFSMNGVPILSTSFLEMFKTAVKHWLEGATGE